MANLGYDVRFPAEYDYEEGIWTAKGYLAVEVHRTGPPASMILLTFYDRARLLQDIESDFERGDNLFTAENVVVVPEVTRALVIDAIAELARRRFEGLAVRVE
jgi:hypothetical protein